MKKKKHQKYTHTLLHTVDLDTLLVLTLSERFFRTFNTHTYGYSKIKEDITKNYENSAREKKRKENRPKI